MNIKEFSRLLTDKQRELEDLCRRKMPVLIGRMAKDHYQDNFRKGGFVDGGLKKWTPAKRLSSGGTSAGANYGTLLSSRNHLFSSISYNPGDGRVKVSNNVPYASAHNFGETVKSTVTPRMRKFAWAKYYEAGGGKKGDPAKNPRADMWKGLALTKKKNLNIKLPQRQFIGESAELNAKINDRVDSEIRQILNF